MLQKKCEYTFICDKTWDDLELTDKKKVRFCASCEKKVYKCTTFKDFQKCAKNQQCVCYIDYDQMVTLGLPSSPKTMEDGPEKEALINQFKRPKEKISWLHKIYYFLVRQ